MAERISSLAGVPTVPVAGLLVPAPMVPRIIAAFRNLYPTVTADLADEPAVRAVLVHLITTSLATYEGSLAEQPMAGQLDEVRLQFAEKARQARERAVSDASLIRQIQA